MLAKLDAAQRRDRTKALPRRNRRWMVLRTKSRQEKAVARCAEALDIEHYLPLLRRVNVIHRRKCVSQVPVFPGYVFIMGEPDDAYEPALSRRICQVINVPDQDRFLREISQIQRALEEESALELYPFVAAGQRCRVASGPLSGLEGVVIERKKCSRLVLQVEIIGQGVALEIDVGMLEPVD